MKVKSTADFNYYLYRSVAKLDMLYEQIAGSDKRKSSIEWKVDIKAFAFSKKSEVEGEIDADDKMRVVLAELESRQLIGTIDDNKPYIKGIMPMRWGMYNDSKFRPADDGPLVWFSGIERDLLLGMGGSSRHVEGCYGATATSSRSVTPTLVRFLRGGMDEGNVDGCRLWMEDNTEDQLVAEAMGLANYYLRGPIQSLEFVAKVLWRMDRYARIRPFQENPYGRALLATPLYVAQTEIMLEDDDNEFRKRMVREAESSL